MLKSSVLILSDTNNNHESSHTLCHCPLDEEEKTNPCTCLLELSLSIPLFTLLQVYPPFPISFHLSKPSCLSSFSLPVHISSHLSLSPLYMSLTVMNGKGGRWQHHYSSSGEMPPRGERGRGKGGEMEEDRERGCVGVEWIRSNDELIVARLPPCQITPPPNTHL